MKPQNAFVFPGQGSQAVGMGKTIYNQFSIAKQTFEEASDVLNIDMRKLCFDDPDKKLDLTEFTQPALLTTSVATTRVLESVLGVSAFSTAGHSIGEYAAIVLAKALPFERALPAVRARGQFMQDAVPLGEGGMIAALGLDLQEAEQVCHWVKKESGKEISPANINAPGQIVLSGSMSGVQWLRENFDVTKALPSGNSDAPVKRVKLIPLTVSAPFHCALMAPAERKMRELLELEKFTDGYLPVVQNFTATPVTEAQELRENLIRQVSSPVRWIECVQKLEEIGSTVFIELGHGKVLSGLIGKITDGRIKCLSTQSLEDFKAIEAAACV